jgi:hypothetical protein
MNYKSNWPNIFLNAKHKLFAAWCKSKWKGGHRPILKRAHYANKWLSIDFRFWMGFIYYIGLALQSATLTMQGSISFVNNFRQKLSF